MHLSFLILLVVFQTAWVVTAAPNNGICYNIDQVQAVSSAGAPCDSEAEVSVCCEVGSICLSNGLCETINQTQQSSFFTGDCTDSSWNSSTCPKICNNNRTRQVTFYDIALLKRIIQFNFDREMAFLTFNLFFLYAVSRIIRIVSTAKSI